MKKCSQKQIFVDAKPRTGTRKIIAITPSHLRGLGNTVRHVNEFKIHKRALKGKTVPWSQRGGGEFFGIWRKRKGKKTSNPACGGREGKGGRGGGRGKGKETGKKTPN